MKGDTGSEHSSSLSVALFLLQGGGGGGKVKRCRHKLDEKEYAVKIIPYEEEKETETLNELKIISTFQHPNVVRYYFSWKEDFVLDSKSADSCSSSSSDPDKTLYIAMELCKGTLKGEFLKKRKFSLEETTRMFKEMAEGLKCIHEKDVIHCDIAADNIFLDFEGHAKIGDFGLAEVLKGGMTFIECAPRGKVVYHAPELSTKNDEKLVKFSKATDIYSLGLVMLQVLFPSETNMGSQVLFDEAKEENFREMPTNTCMPQYVMIMKMLSLNAAARPTASQIIDKCF